LKAFMNWAPANVDITALFLNSLRSWTSGANCEPYAADAMTQALEGGVAVTVTDVISVVV